MAMLALLPPVRPQAPHRPVMERAAEIFLAAFPGLSPAMLLAAAPSPLSLELAAALAAVRSRHLRCVPG